jgi:uncharacterized membrane protein YcaP (DUF421 family)
MDVILRATLMYWVLVFALRLLGRRAVSQLSAFELIVIFLLGGLTVQSIVADDRSVVSAITGVFTVAINHSIASALKERYVGLRKLLEGTPIVVVENGKIHENRLKGLRMLEEDVLAAVRRAGSKSLDQVRLAVVERDGNISVFCEK